MTGLLSLGCPSLRMLSDDIDSSFDGLMSTSNHVIEDEVWIKNSEPIVWTIAMKSLVL